MSDRKTDIWVYAAWQGLPTPTLLGKLSAAPGKDGQALRFCYHND